MATDIIAQQIVQNTVVLQPGMSLNPFFDAPAPILGIFGIPNWLPMSIIVIAVAIAWPNLYWWRRMAFLKPVKGYRDTLRQATQEDVQTWVLGKTMKLTIEMLRYVDGVLAFYTPTRISKWLHTTRQAVMHCGGLPALLVSDDYDRTRDVVAEIAICNAAETYNTWLKPVEEILTAIGTQDAAALERLKKYVDTEHIDDIREALAKAGSCDIKEIKPITSFGDYEKCGHKFLRILWPKGIPVPSYSIYNPVKFSRYFPKGRSAGLNGRILLRESRDLRMDQPKEDWKKDLVKMGAIVVICMLLLLVAWMAPLGMSHTAAVLMMVLP